MEPENSRPERHRRSGRRTEESLGNVGYFPEADPAPASPPPVRTPRRTRTEGFERPRYEAAPEPVRKPDRRKESGRVPTWLTVSLIAAFMLCLALFAGEQLMNAYLKKTADAKREDYQRIVQQHPLYDNYVGMVEKYAAQYNLQPAFVSAIILNESSWKPTAESYIGARGMMQLMEATAADINDDYLHIPGYTFQMLWDPETNIRFGCQYLHHLSLLFGGDPVAVTAAYHGGKGNVRNWLSDRSISEDGHSFPISSIPIKETRDYTGKVMRSFAIYDALYFHAYNSGDTAIVNPDLAGSTGSQQ